MSKTKPSKGKSPFWKPENEGDKMEGTYIGFQTTTSPDGKPGMAFNLLLKAGTILVPVSSGLKRMFADQITKLRSGKTKLKFVFVERVKIKKGRSFKKFRAWLDGKELEDKGGYNNTPSPAQVKDFWKS